MLLLMLGGSDKRDIVNNYIQTYQNLLRDERYLHTLANGIAHHMMESRAEYIETAYAYVESCGGIIAYLIACGLSDDVLYAVKGRLAHGRVSEMAVAG
jgi:hypothetical protein